MRRRSRTLYSGAFVVGGLTVGILAALILNYMLYAYLNLGLEGAVSEYMSAMLLALGVGLGILFLPLSSRTRRTLLGLWAIRCFVTLILMVAYEQHYLVLDAFTYYRTASRGHENLSFEWMQGTQNLIYLISIVMDWFPIFKSYPALKVLFSAFGLMGSYLFWRTYVEITDEENHKLLFVLGAFPSLLFWSSILGKDPVVFMGLGLISLACVKLLRRPNLDGTMLLIAGVTVVATIRLWVAVCVLLSFSLTYLFSSSRLIKKSQITKVLVLVVFCFLAGTMFDKLSFNSQDDVYDRINTVSRGWSAGGSQQEVPRLKSLKEIIFFLPKGMFTALFRPLPGEVNNIFGLFAGLENLILLFIAIRIFRETPAGMLKEKNYRFLVMTVIIWSMLYSMISYQNLGTASRFKIQALPYLLLLFYYLNFRNNRAEDAKRVFGSPRAFAQL